MTPEEILIESTKKLIELSSISDWDNELLSKAPPVLWFGNANSSKPKILTIGANPSRWEFLNQSQMKAYSIPVAKQCYETKYLSEKRFCHLSPAQTYNDILSNESLRNSIIDSYNSYYLQNPYKWFGSNKEDSYNVEGVLRGMNASYFEVDSEFRACHIDIFPFATISDYTQIKQIAEKDILSDSWAKKIVEALLGEFSPELVLIFGITNINYFRKYFELNIFNGSKTKWQAKKGSGSCNYWNAQYQKYKILGVSTNLGNPRGFDAAGLRELGNELHNFTKP